MYDEREEKTISLGRNLAVYWNRALSFKGNLENFDFELKVGRHVNKNGPGAEGPLDPLKITSLSLIRPRARHECHVNSIMLFILSCFFLPRCLVLHVAVTSHPIGNHREK